MDSGNHDTDPRNGLPKPAGEDELEFWKRYLLEHPDNKMAWYLLGKAYDRQKKPGKANYCYMRSGDVYQAFEKKAMALAAAEHLDTGESEPAGADTDQSGKPNRRWMAALLLIGLLMLAVAGTVQVEHPSADQSSEEKPEQVAGQAAEDGQSAAEEPTPAKPEGGYPVEHGLSPVQSEPPKWSVHLLAADHAAEEPWREDAAAVIGETLVDTGSSSANTYIVQANSVAAGNRQWIQWVNGMNVLVAIDKPDGSGVSRVRHYDARLCECLPAAAPAQAAAAVQAWQRAQEELLVAMSAAERYRQHHARLLEDERQLTEDYPNNALPGLTALMSAQLSRLPASMDATRTDREGEIGQQPFAYFPTHAQLQFAGEGSEKDAAAILDDSFNMQGEGEQARRSLVWQQPLEIIVDTTAHKLAVVSGSVILRNYSVGLGGDRTPLGEFEITEKVRNPNGRDDGDFGSRGMTLSDTLYAIHGTNEPESIGKDESLGCIRMGKEDVEELFDMVPLGTKVTIMQEGLPEQEMVPDVRFRVPSEAEETNDAKVYRWL